MAGLVALGLAACEPAPADEEHADVPPGPKPNVYVPPGGCSGPDEYRMLSWGEGELRAVRPGCLRLPEEALASLRAACAKTPTEPVWVDARRLGPGEPDPCAGSEVPPSDSAGW